MHFVIFEDEITILLRKLERSAFELKSKFDGDDSLEVIKGKLEIFNNIYHDLKLKIDKDIFYKSELSRHVRCLNLYISKHDTKSCLNDIAQICETDIEELRKVYLDNARSNYVDSELQGNIKSLLESNELDSAVRKAFLTLTERLRTKYNIGKKRDGIDLINRIFGNSGCSKLTSSEKESMRNLLAGMYGIFRNDFMHSLNNKKETEISAIHMVNTILNLLDDID